MNYRTLACVFPYFLKYSYQSEGHCHDDPNPAKTWVRVFDIDGEFIRRAKAEGVPLEVEKLVQKRIGVRGK